MHTTFSEHCKNLATNILCDYKHLIDHHTKLEYNDPYHGWIVRMSIHGDYALKVASKDGQILLNKIRKSFTNLTSLLDSIFLDLDESENRNYCEGKNTIEYALKYQWTTSESTESEATKITNAFDKMLSIFETIDDEGERTPIVIPDTNALITHHQLAKWTFETLESFRLILLPTVLSEIGIMKTEHRSENVRKKADSLNRQIKDFRSRGSLLEGVNLVTGMSSLLAIPIEPNFEKAPNWLDKSSNDDRILVGVVEIVKRYPHTPIFVVSYDINFQNKAEYLGIPFLEPDVITTPSPRISNTNT